MKKKSFDSSFLYPRGNLNVITQVCTRRKERFHNHHCDNTMHSS